MAEDAWDEELLPDEESAPREEQVSTAACASQDGLEAQKIVRPDHTKGLPSVRCAREAACMRSLV